VRLSARRLAPTRNPVSSREAALTDLSGSTIAASVDSSLETESITTNATSFTLPEIPTSDLDLDLDSVSPPSWKRSSTDTGQSHVSTPGSESRGTTPEQDHWPQKVVSPPASISGSDSIPRYISGRKSLSCESDQSFGSGSWQSCLEKVSISQPPRLSLLPASLLPDDIWGAKSSLMSDWFDGCAERSVV
jgi:hypothetical protein